MMYSIPLDWRTQQFSIQQSENSTPYTIDLNEFDETIRHCNEVSASLTSSIRKHRLYIACIFTISLVIFLFFALIPLIGVVIEELKIFLFLYGLLPFGVVIFIGALLWSLYSTYRKLQDWKQEMSKQLNQILETDNKSKYFSKGFELRYCVQEQKQIDKYNVEHVIEIPSIEIHFLTSHVENSSHHQNINTFDEEGHFLVDER